MQSFQIYGDFTQILISCLLEKIRLIHGLLYLHGLTLRILRKTIVGQILKYHLRQRKVNSSFFSKHEDIF